MQSVRTRVGASVRRRRTRAWALRGRLSSARAEQSCATRTGSAQSAGPYPAAASEPRAEFIVGLRVRARREVSSLARVPQCQNPYSALRRDSPADRIQSCALLRLRESEASLALQLRDSDDRGTVRRRSSAKRHRAARVRPRGARHWRVQPPNALIGAVTYRIAVHISFWVPQPGNTSSVRDEVS